MYEEAKKGTDAMENQENPFNDTKFLDLDDVVIQMPEI